MQKINRSRWVFSTGSQTFENVVNVNKSTIYIESKQLDNKLKLNYTEKKNLEIQIQKLKSEYESSNKKVTYFSLMWLPLIQK